MVTFADISSSETRALVLVTCYCFPFCIVSAFAGAAVCVAAAVARLPYRLRRCGVSADVLVRHSHVLRLPRGHPHVLHLPALRFAAKTVLRQREQSAASPARRR